VARNRTLDLFFNQINNLLTFCGIYKTLRLMPVSRDDFLTLINLPFARFQKRAQRGQIPMFRRGPPGRNCEFFDVLVYEICEDLSRGFGIDLTAASEIIYRAMNVLRALTFDLDVNPEGPAFLCVGFCDERDNLNAWGGAASLDEIIANRPTDRYFRIITIDVALAAARIRARAAKAGIALDRFSAVVGKTGKSTVLRSKHRLDG
jgi:hypothetical protein